MLCTGRDKRTDTAYWYLIDVLPDWEVSVVLTVLIPIRPNFRQSTTVVQVPWHPIITSASLRTKCCFYINDSGQGVIAGIGRYTAQSRFCAKQ